MQVSSLVGFHLRYLVDGLNKKNKTKTVQEVHDVRLRVILAHDSQLVDAYGHEAQLLFLQCLLDDVNLGGPEARSIKDALKLQLLAQELESLTNGSTFIGDVCSALDSIVTSRDALANLVRLANLPFPVEVGVSLALTHSSKEDVQGEVTAFLVTRLSDVDEAQLGKLSDHVAHQLLYFLTRESANDDKKQVFTGLIRKLISVAPSLIRNAGDHSQPLQLLLSDNSISPVHNSMRKSEKEYPSIGAVQVASACSFAELCLDLGLDSVATVASARELMKQVETVSGRGIDAVALARTLCMMARTQSQVSVELQEDEGQTQGWSIVSLLDAAIEHHPDLGKSQWSKVLANLDHPDLGAPDLAGFKLIASANLHITREPLPVGFLLKRWENHEGQLNMIHHAITSGAEFASFEELTRRIPSLGDVPVSSTSALSEHIWTSLDLTESLLDIAREAPHLREQVRGVFNIGIRECPELVFVAMSKAGDLDQPTSLQLELLSGLCGTFLLVSTSNSSVMMRRVWEINQQALIFGLCEVYLNDTSTLSRILDIAQELRALAAVLQKSDSYAFQIDLASLAARREFINLELWLVEHLRDEQGKFAAACITYLQEKTLRAQTDRVVPATTLSLETLNVFFRVLHQHVQLLTAPQQEELRLLYTSCAQANARLASVGAQEPPPPPPQGSGEQFTAEIEEAANTYFQQIYTEQMSIDQVVALLKKFRSSEIQREQDIFSCMIHNLFDEYRFFPRYPDKELHITAMLFGSLIKHQLVSYIPLGIALRYVLEALRKPYGSKMFKFGYIALLVFKSRLSEWPQYCAHVVAIPHLKQHVSFIHQELVNNDIDPDFGSTEPALPPLPVSLAGEEVPNGVVDAVATSSMSENFAIATTTTTTTTAAVTSATSGEARGVRVPSGASASGAAPSLSTQIPIDSLVHALPSLKISEGIEDHIAFVFNNMTIENVKQKAAELKDALKDVAKPNAYLAQYIVVTRASVEPNFHSTYLGLLDALDDAELYMETVKVTLECARILVTGDKVKKSSSERSLLKNIGSFLSQLTLVKDKPILAKDLDLKKLILEAFQEGRLIAVIPFVAKILEWSKDSKIFAPPNPWIMSILRLLIEIYEYRDLKLNLKFEVEVLLKALGLKQEDIKATSLLNDIQLSLQTGDFVPQGPVTRTENAASGFVPQQGNGIRPSLTADSLHTIANGVSVAEPVVSETVAQPERAMSAPPLDEVPTSTPAPRKGISNPIIASITQYVQVNANLPLFQEQPALKRVVPMALEAAIREIIAPVVERSATIACVAARELVIKDFVMEPDETRMRTAAHVMAQNLAGSLALVTCKEPLRVSMGQHLRSLIQQSNQASDDSAVDKVVQVCGAENLELGCALIEREATDRAIAEIDEQLASAYAARRKHRERTPHQPFVDMNVFSNGRFPASLPEPLRPRPGGLLAQQLRVYEEFSRIPRRAPPSEQESPEPQTTDAEFPTLKEIATEATPAKPEAPNVVVLSQLTAILGSIDEALQAAAPASKAELASMPLSQLPPTHPARGAVVAMSRCIQNCPANSREEVALAFAKRVFARLFERGGEDPQETLVRTVLIGGLLTALDANKKIESEFIEWFSAIDETQRFSRRVVVNLIRAGILKVKDLDPILAKSMDSGRNEAASSLSVQLLQLCVSDDKLITASDMTATLEVLDSVAARANSQDLIALVNKAKKTEAPPPETPAEPEPETPPPVAVAVPPVTAPARKPVIVYPTGEDSLTPGRDFFSDSPDFIEKVILVFEEWVSICSEGAAASPKASAGYVTMLQQKDVLRGDDAASHFFRVITEYSVAHATKPMEVKDEDEVVLDYTRIDAFAKLVVLLVKFAADPMSSGLNRSAVVSRVLGVVAPVLAREHAIKGPSLNPRPYFRLFVTWLGEFAAHDPVLEAVALPVLTAFGNMFHAIQPLRLPGFAFAWLELISHRHFMTPLLLGPYQQKGWLIFERLLVDFFMFLNPYLAHAVLDDATRQLYKGVLRVLLVLLHDVPEFLCDCHFSLCGALPPTCVQMRNLILSAFPRNMRLPDPFTPNLKVDLLPEIHKMPNVLSDVTSILDTTGLKRDLDAFLQTRTPVSALEIARRVELSDAEKAEQGMKYDVPLINSVVMYCGMQAVSRMQQAPQTPIVHSPAADVLQQLALDLDAEGRYHFINGIVNQLRYPNAHTHYFSWMLLVLFSEAKHEVIQEQITRVLLERLIVNRPHPWGLLITFIELIKNPRYRFWGHGFVRCAPEIERLFESVARSCMGQSVSAAQLQQQQAMTDSMANERQ